jgi:hypothetical protein
MSPKPITCPDCGLDIRVLSDATEASSCRSTGGWTAAAYHFTEHAAAETQGIHLIVMPHRKHKRFHHEIVEPFGAFFGKGAQSH